MMNKFEQQATAPQESREPSAERRRELIDAKNGLKEVVENIPREQLKKLVNGLTFDLIEGCGGDVNRYTILKMEDESGNDPDVAAFHVAENLNRIRDSLLEGQRVNPERKKLLRRSDVNEAQSKDLSESFNLLLVENGFKPGDKIIFFVDREREGVLERDRDGKLSIRDTNGLPWGMLGVISNLSGYIRKP